MSESSWRAGRRTHRDDVALNDISHSSTTSAPSTHLVLAPASIQSTQLNEHLWTQVLKHLSVHIYSLLYIKYYNQLDSRTDLSSIPVRSAVKSYITSWCIQNLSRRALNRQTVSTSTTKLGRLFQILTIRAEKNTFVYRSETYD